MAQVSKQTLDFLNDLAAHNNRDWFLTNKRTYETVKRSHEALIGALIEQIGQFEDLAGVQPKECNFRINRDVRFSADKSPYKTWLSASIAEGGKKSAKQSYYLQVQPGGQSFLGGGLYAPTAEQLAQLRQEIDYEPDRIKQIIYEPAFVSTFGAVQGNTLKSAPKGYDKQHENIELLRKTQFYVIHAYTDAEVLSEDFVEKVGRHCRQMKPFLDYYNDILR